MKRILWVGAALAALASTSATAGPIEFTHVVGVNKWLNSWEYTSWEHVFTLSPAAQTIYDAKLTISFGDDDTKDRVFRGELEFGVGGIIGSLWEIAFDEIDPGNRTFDVGVSQLQDGVLGIWAKSLYGDFKIKTSSLWIKYEPTGTTQPPVSVPEPTTLGLLGLGLLSLGLVARRSLRGAAR